MAAAARIVSRAAAVDLPLFLRQKWNHLLLLLHHSPSFPFTINTAAGIREQHYQQQQPAPPGANNTNTYCYGGFNQYPGCMSHVVTNPLRRLTIYPGRRLVILFKRTRRLPIPLLLLISFTFLLLSTVLLSHYYNISIPILSSLFGLIGIGSGSGMDAYAPRVVLPQGTYVGLTLEKSRHLPRAVEAFLGIPYGQNTAGENRFRPPKRLPTGVTRRVRVFEAKAVGEVCSAMGKVGGGFGEDCLNLNVYRTAGVVLGQGKKREKGGNEKSRRSSRITREKRSEGEGIDETVVKEEEEELLLPIVVYIHGGGFNTGNGNERNMGSFVSWAKEPMIGINFNYRVGALGFLPSAVTAREGLLNLGLRDQQLLLEWVKENALAFGGDPENITIMGLSAGAHSIGHHIMYYANSSTPAPFHKAILESGATTARAVLLPTHPRHLIQFREFLIAAGLEGVPEDEIFARLREIPLETIARASKSIWDLYEPSVTWPFQPVIDGPHDLANSSSQLTDMPPIIPDLPIHSWRKGKHLRIPVMTGFNSNEGTVFVPSNANTNSEFRAFFKALIPGLTINDLDELEKLYPDPVTHLMSPYRSVPQDKGRQWARLDAAYSHYAYICPVLQTAHFLSDMTDAKVPVYVYRYAAKGSWGTANHGDEAPIVAHDVGFLDNHGGMPGLTGVSDAMHAAWSQFVISKTGNITTPAPTATTTASLTKKSEGGGDGNGVEWPEFKSPFSREEAGQLLSTRSWLWGLGSGDGPSGDTGRIIVFGEGNDERMGPNDGKMAEGVAAQVKTLSSFELDACRFWWSRIELSQGLGRREEKEKEAVVEDGKIKAKL